jgi:hypothetical protein
MKSHPTSIPYDEERSSLKMLEIHSIQICLVARESMQNLSTDYAYLTLPSTILGMVTRWKTQVY